MRICSRFGQKLFAPLSPSFEVCQRKNVSSVNSIIELEISKHLIPLDRLNHPISLPGYKCRIQCTSKKSRVALACVGWLLGSMIRHLRVAEACAGVEGAGGQTYSKVARIAANTAMCGSPRMANGTQRHDRLCICKPNGWLS